MKKNYLDTFKIDIFRLDNKQYVHEFEGDDVFFAQFEQDIISKGHFKAIVTLDKSETMIQLLYNIEALVELTCDKSLELYEEPIQVKHRLILKYADHTEEITDELMLIERGTQQINIAQDLFDFIFLEIPIKKLHPKFRTQDEVLENHFDWEDDEAFDDEDDDEALWDDDEASLDWEDEEGELVYTTRTEEDEDDDEDEPADNETESPDDAIDPRWAALKNLRNNFN